MLKDIAGGLFKQAIWPLVRRKTRRLAKEAVDAAGSGKPREAIELFEKYLRYVPNDTGVMVSLGVCLAEIGQEKRAHALFELAYMLDDSDISAAVSYARALVEQRRVAEALPLLVRAQAVVGDAPHVYSVYTSITLLRADANGAKAYALRAWLGNFNNLRLGDSYLFNSAYADIPEKLLAAEHDFWGGTCLDASHEPPDTPARKSPNKKGTKLRIGYWSPDLREHSVRFFFRPLLEGHDRNRVELIVYNDAVTFDAQTEQVRLHCDEFHNVYEKKDEELRRFILSHRLDVLVELAGHTSYNRLPMLKTRMASMQVTAIGYPFTTGLRSIDVKLSDPYIHTAEDQEYYSEEPLILPSSFWCFDPLMDVPAPEGPPVLKSGYITFGCSGNVGKINDKILDCWLEILRRVPRSRLVLRSVSFEEPYSIEAMEKKLLRKGFSRNRFDLLRPAMSIDFYASYNNLDIVLDTHPFNGGTTTAFAVYMGAPVISWRGSSLLSRMGHSILNNVGAGDLVVDSAEKYITRAVALSQDIPYLKRFRHEARGLMAKGSLGNGKMFARDFEDACERFLREQTAGRRPYEPRIAVLPPEELIRRAYTVLGFGQQEEAARIVSYCLKNYPNFAAAHILATENLTHEGRFLEASEKLIEIVDQYEGPDRIALLINIFRYFVLAEKRDRANAVLGQLESSSGAEPREQLQFHMFRAWSEVGAGFSSSKKPSPVTSFKNIHIVVPCDDANTYKTIVDRMKRDCQYVAGCKITYTRCSESGRLRTYQSVLQDAAVDMVVMLQKNILVHSSEFFYSLASALETADVVGYSGATRWARLDWEHDEFGQRAMGCLIPSGEKDGFWEAQVVGDGLEEIKGDMCLLAGGLLAVRLGKARAVAFDAELIGGNGLLEQVWSYDAAQAGCRLAVHRNLGVLVGNLPVDNKYLATVRMQVVERMKFDVLALLSNNQSTISVPCASSDEALAVLGRYLQITEPGAAPA